MLPQLFVSAALFTAGALSATVPAALALPSLTAAPVNTGIWALAASRNINLAGPIPADATPIEGGFEFTADSDAAIWVRAQLLPSAESTITKRQNANIGIGMFNNENCQGNGAWIDNVVYGTSVSRGFDHRSVGISYRGLGDGEHLDFSRYTNQNLNLCGTYVYSAAPYTQPGCWNTQPVTCFKLWR